MARRDKMDRDEIARRISKIKEIIEAAREDLVEFAADGWDHRRILRLVTKIASETPSLLKCAPFTIKNALYDAARVGLDPTGPFGEAYLVPRWNSNLQVYEAKFTIGYKGFCKIALETGVARRIAANPICKEEVGVFECDRAMGTIKHPFVDGLDATDESNFVAAYAAIWTPQDPDHAVIELLDREQVMDRLAVSASDGAVRLKWPDRMWRKTAIRTAFNSGAVLLSQRLIDALDIDTRNNIVDQDEVTQEKLAKPGAAGVAARALAIAETEQRQQAVAPALPNTETAESVVVEAPEPVAAEAARADDDGDGESFFDRLARGARDEPDPDEVRGLF